MIGGGGSVQRIGWIPPVVQCLETHAERVDEHVRVLIYIVAGANAPIRGRIQCCKNRRSVSFREPTLASRAITLASHQAA
jgi:hypothetical protein